MGPVYISTTSWYVPENYVRPESERPKLSEVEDCEDVPIIDLVCDDITTSLDATKIKLTHLEVELKLLQAKVDNWRAYPVLPCCSLEQHDGEVHERCNQELCCLFNMFHKPEIGAKKLDVALKSLKEKYYDSRMHYRKCFRRGDVPSEPNSCSNDREVHERCNQELYCLFNMFHNHEIGAKKLDAALKSLKEKYYDSRMHCRKCIRRGDVAGTSLLRPSSLEGGGVLVGIGLVNNNGDPSSSVKHSPPGKGKVSYEEGAGGFANVSGDATSSMNAPCEGDLEMGCVNNNNGDPPAPGDVPSPMVPHVAHTADRSGSYGVNVARTVFRVSAAAASRTTTSNFAKASHTTGLANSGAAILLADTHWKAVTPILAKAGIVACGVGVLADMGKDLPLPFFMGAMTAAIFIIIVAMVFAKRLA